MAPSERRTMWQHHVEACNQSGQGISAWCKENDVSKHRMKLATGLTFSLALVDRDRMKA